MFPSANIRFPGLSRGEGFPLTEQTTDDSTGQCHPEVGGKAHDQHGEHGTCASHQQDRFSTDSIGEASPEDASQAFGKGEGGNEDAGVEGCIALIADVEVSHHDPSVWEAIERQRKGLLGSCGEGEANHDARATGSARRHIAE